MDEQLEAGHTDPAVGAGGASYLTLTGLVLTFAFWMCAGRLVWGSFGMWASAALVGLWYALAIWRASHPATSGREAANDIKTH
jgi:hypothetical protein